MARAAVTVDLGKIKKNARIIIEKCAGSNIEVAAVTKMHSGDVLIARALTEAGIKYLADSRLENLKNFFDAGIPAERWLMRISAPSLAEEVVKYADMSFQSEISTIRLLDTAAAKQQKRHDVLLMWDLGDLREGYFDFSELADCAKEITNMPNIRLRGLGTNLSCYGGIKPTNENLTELVRVAERLKEYIGSPLPIISGGNSTSYSLLLAGGMPEGINNLRIGDTFYLGRDMQKREYLDYMENDAFVLSAEIVEIKKKPSVPIGESGYAALNTKPVFEKRGEMVRAICSVGKQDIDLDMHPTDPRIEILGASSDHLLCNITDCATDYSVGDTLRFNMLYTSAMRAFTSKYIDKIYKD